MKNLLLGLTMMVTLVGCGTDVVDEVETPDTDIAIEQVEEVEQDESEESVESEDEEVVEEEQPVEEEVSQETGSSEIVPEGYTYLETDGGSTSGHRQPMTVTNIGFGDREYYAYTNEHGQLVRVTAKEIILQNDNTEPVNSDGRYYSRMADVPGVGADTGYDRGHIIADSLGGVANSYNITPQEATLNRHGDQAYMERAIRDAGGATNFEAIITYPNTETQIPSHYKYTYTIKGHTVVDEFENGNPDELNKAMGLTGNTEEPKQETSAPVSSGDGVWVDENGNGLIKGSNSGIYHTPESSYYDRTTSPKEMFKTVQEAVDAGYRAPKN